MNKINLFSSALALICILLWVGCGKEGPQGIPGTVGNPGPAGVVGPAGKDGNALLTGNDVPDSKTGNTGDYYLDRNSGAFYGPKTANGWGTPVTLSSNKGSSILSGSNTPGSSNGDPGDFYLDTIHYTLYGPKIGTNHWGTGILLQGSGPNAGVMAFSITNPYEYIVTDTSYYSPYSNNDFGFFLKVPYDEQNSFNLWTDINDQHDMVEVYLLKGQIIYDSEDDSTGYKEIYVPAYGDFTSYLVYGDFNVNDANLYISAEVFDNGLKIDFDGDALNCDCDFIKAKNLFINLTDIKSILVFVISPSATHNVTPSLPPPPDFRILNPATHPRLQQLTNPFLKVHP
ncbi:MAG: hypothetical protein ABI237_08305 [Ginsengibacter sp.]